MSTLSRYLFKQIGLATLVIVVTLSAAIWLTQSLRFIDWIVNRGLPVSTFITVAILILPSFLTVILPIALFSAVLFTYNKLQGDSELVVMRAVGAGPGLLIGPALAVAAVATLFMYALNLYLLPVSYRSFKDLQNDIRNNYTGVLVQEGVFNTIDQGLMLFVREQGSGGDLYGIMVQDERQAEKPSTVIAERGAIVNTPEGPRLVMNNGNRQELNRRDGKVSFLFFDSYTVDLNRLSGEMNAIRQRDTTERFVDELLAPDDITDQVTLNRFRAEGHQRLANPLSVLGYTLIALAAMLSGDFSRRGQTRQMMAAAGVVLVLEALSLSFGNLTAKFPLLVPMLYVINIVPICLGLARLLRRPGAVPATGPAFGPPDGPEPESVPS